MLSPVFVEVGEESSDKADFYKVNIDENPDLGTENKIMTVPTILVFKYREVFNKSVGYIAKDKLISIVEKHL